jgi:hypothetical protein
VEVLEEEGVVIVVVAAAVVVVDEAAAVGVGLGVDAVVAIDEAVKELGEGTRSCSSNC